jgi:hypothetical protein
MGEVSLIQARTQAGKGLSENCNTEKKRDGALVDSIGDAFQALVETTETSMAAEFHKLSTMKTCIISVDFHGKK